MLRTLLVFLCLAATALAADTPRKLADVTIAAPLGGKDVKLSSYRGKILLIAIISTECATCAQSVQLLNKIQKEYGPKGVQVVAAAVNEGAVTLVNAFIDRYQPNFPVGLLTQDETRELADFGVNDRPYVPIFLFVDRQGTVTQQFFGDSPFFQAEDKSTRGLLNNMLGAQ